jgi:hypothetical protein
MTDSPVRLPNRLEQHILSIGVTVIGGLVLSIFFSTNDLGKITERTEAKVGGMENAFMAMETRLTTLQDRLSASYLAADARRDLESRDQAIIRLEERIRSLERALSSLEGRVQPGQAPRQEAPAPPVLSTPAVPTEGAKP